MVLTCKGEWSLIARVRTIALSHAALHLARPLRVILERATPLSHIVSESRPDRPPSGAGPLSHGSKDGGRPDQLVLYRDAPASDFLAGKTLEAECPQYYTWQNMLRGYCRCEYLYNGVNYIIKIIYVIEE